MKCPWDPEGSIAFQRDPGSVHVAGSPDEFVEVKAVSGEMITCRSVAILARQVRQWSYGGRCAVAQVKRSPDTSRTSCRAIEEGGDVPPVSVVGQLPLTKIVSSRDRGYRVKSATSSLVSPVPRSTVYDSVRGGSSPPKVTLITWWPAGTAR